MEIVPMTDELIEQALVIFSSLSPGREVDLVSDSSTGSGWATVKIGPIKSETLNTLVRRYKAMEEALKHYADESHWQEANAHEAVTYCVWKDYPREMYNGYDIAQQALKDGDK